MPSSSRRFRVHDFFEIRVADNVPSRVKQLFDFHLQYFEVETDARSPLPILSVYPFDEFEPEDQESKHYDTAGKYEEYWYSNDTQLAVQRIDDGLNIYTNSGINIYPYLQDLLLKQRGVFVHAAGYVNEDGSATLLPGSGGVGKTALLGNLVRNHGMEVLGDDVIILTAAGKCYSLPRSFVFKQYHRDVYPDVFDRFNLKRKEVRDGIMTPVVNFTIQNAPFMGLIKSLLHKLGYYNTAASTVSKVRGDDFLATIPVKEIFGPDSIATEANLEKVVFLRRADQSTFSLEPISRTRLENRMFSIIMREWQDNISELHELGSLELLNLHSYFDEMSRITAEAITDVPCYEFVIPSDASPEQLTETYLQQCESGTISETK